MQHKLLSTYRYLFLTLLCFLASEAAFAASGKEIWSKRCAQCHDLNAAGPTSLNELFSQNGPNLSFAGLKYKKSWLEKWLQSPTRIRPAGMFYGNHIKPGKDQDQVVQSTLVKHEPLNKEDAVAVTKTLMSYQAKKDIFESGAYKPGSISISMGDLLFDKFRGCLSCHRIERDYGGLSGPEVYTVVERLQEDYIVNFLRNPQAWSPKNFMPQYNLKESDVQKFVHYFRALAQENKK